MSPARPTGADQCRGTLPPILRACDRDLGHSLDAALQIDRPGYPGRRHPCDSHPEGPPRQATPHAPGPCQSGTFLHLAFISSASSSQVSLFGPPDKGAAFARDETARPEKLKGPAAEQAPLMDRVTASLTSSGRSGLTNAEVRCRPFCALATVTWATVSTPHFRSIAPAIPAADIHAIRQAIFMP